MEIEIEEIEKEDVVKKKKGSKKKYLYALGVILVAGLFLGSATHIPIGVQFVTPALSSVSYFFGGGHGGNAQFAYYYLVEKDNAVTALENALFDVGIGYILKWLDADVVTGISDYIASVADYAGTVTASTIITALSLYGVSFWIVWIVTPLAITIAAL